MDINPPTLLIIIMLLVAAAFIAVFLSQLKKETGKIEITNGSGAPVSVSVELADNDARRMQGLMFRNQLAENEGMLFVFDNEDYRTFWMMNTTIPLDAVFFSSNGTVVDIIQMEPCKSIIFCKTYQSAGKAKYVLEVNRGFADKNGITVGKSRMSLIKEN